MTGLRENQFHDQTPARRPRAFQTESLDPPTFHRCPAACHCPHRTVAMQSPTDAKAQLVSAILKLKPACCPFSANQSLCGPLSPVVWTSEVETQRIPDPPPSPGPCPTVQHDCKFVQDGLQDPHTHRLTFGAQSYIAARCDAQGRQGCKILLAHLFCLKRCQEVKLDTSSPPLLARVVGKAVGPGCGSPCRVIIERDHAAPPQSLAAADVNAVTVGLWSAEPLK